MIKFLFSIIFVLFCCSSAIGDTWYVSSTGAGTGDGVSWANAGDNGDGTFVNDSTIAGDTVVFAPGEYDLSQPLVPVSGTANTDDGRTFYVCSTFIEADPTTGDYNQTILYRGTKITGWADSGGGTWGINSGTSTGPLFVGNRFLFEQGGSGISEGEWYSDGSTITLIYPFDGLDPTTTMVVSNTSSSGAIVTVGSRDYVTIWGLGLMYGNNKTITAPSGGSYAQGPANYITMSHCKLGPCAGEYSSNPGNIATNNQVSNNNNWIIRACSVLAGVALNGTSAQGTHGGGAVTYSMDSMIVDSNWFSGYHTLSTWYLKNDNAYGPTFENIFRYNEFRNSNPNKSHIRVGRTKHNVRIYGNTFISNPGDGGGIIGSPLNEANDSNLIVYNNTFINVGTPLTLRTGDKPASGTRRIKSAFKYNIIYHTAKDTIEVLDTDLGSPADPTIIDSNKYFSADTNWGYASVGAAAFQSMSIIEWQAEGWDVNSVFLTDADEDFNDVAGGDYTRPTASGEMDTTYGGKRWTIYGAFQNSVTINPLNKYRRRSILKNRSEQ